MVRCGSWQLSSIHVVGCHYIDRFYHLFILMRVARVRLKLDHLNIKLMC
jgi:hypothetical protein